MATKTATRSRTASHSTKSSAKKTTTKRATKSPATKTAHSRKHIKGADTHKTPGSKAAQSKKSGSKPSSAQACWPGYEPTPGKKAGEKGSCKPKKHQTAAQRKGDQKAAAAAKLSGQR